MSQLDLDLLLDSVTAETAEALEADTVAILLGDDAAVDDTAGHAMTSVLAVPLVVEGRTVGTAVAGRAGPSPFDEGAAEFLRLVADRVALAVDRARLFREAEATQRRLAFLTAAGEALARSLDGPTLLQTVVDQAVPFLADWCAVDFLADDGDFQCVAAAHRDPDLTPLVRELHDSRPPRIENARGVGRVARTGQSQFWPVVTEQGWAQVAQSPERLAMFRTLAPVSAVIVPLSVRGSMLGTISFIQSSSGRRYTEADLDLAQELVRRVALALDNARLFAERSQVARTLQASLLPPHLPDIPGLEVDGVFRPGGEGVEVGGDFYDVFLTEPGDWAMVVGDVCGKGAEAAAVTALGRYTLRAAAMQARRPSRVLHVLNEAMLRQDPGRPFLTVAYARVQLGDGPDAPVRVTVGCAGHPLPLVVRASGQVEAVGQAGTLLGCFPEFEVEDVSADLSPGDALVLYTDGVDEARNADGEELGVDGLGAVLAQCAGLSAADINRRVVEAVAERQGGRSPDDVAILTARLLPA